ncbi:HAD family phosphatase [Clostridium sp. D2Q-11]|uniref:HAD family phosphatase n=1 Tax=Anaeromonas frigoriresistens TaxID=2683708 RepID=A0A942URV6_9FIRM|nr:HAD family phosphatase [Anaeromonas frigoriresistens]MBS4538109.1 HAD family phosphatase [Anaeromonas frigoriresistens]
MFRGVIFDMDGVIVDTEPIYIEIDKEVFSDYDIYLSEKEIENYIGVNLREIWKELLEKNNLHEKYTVDEVYQHHVNEFYIKLKNHESLVLMSGLEEWLKYFKDNGIKMIIASSSHSRIINFIYEKFNLGLYMEGYVDGNAVENGKPAPDIFLKAAEKLELDPKECIVIEDSQHGVRAAKRAGMKCIGLSNRKSEFQSLELADMVIENFSKDNLKKVLKK